VASQHLASLFIDRLKAALTDVMKRTRRQLERLGAATRAPSGQRLDSRNRLQSSSLEKRSNSSRKVI
jgi:hypothetical protein